MVHLFVHFLQRQTKGDTSSLGIGNAHSVGLSGNRRAKSATVNFASVQ
ncbi:hypothetical protein RRSWK_02063 [Rhodopirellula sp. SWK7]|nr:hypothetical protein RRSWK_02063 [Rhodopirellula sp. SWK7]